MDRANTFNSRTKLVIGKVIIGLFILHVILILTFARKPVKGPDKSHLSIFYRHLVLLGPFFSEDRILTSPHVFARYKIGETWSPFFDNGFLSSERPGKYHDRIIKDFIDHRARAIKSAGTSTRQRERPLRQLAQFLTTEIFKQKTIDSLQIIYLQYWYDPAADRPKNDTLFQLKYAPQLVENVE